MVSSEVKRMWGSSRRVPGENCSCPIAAALLWKKCLEMCFHHLGVRQDKASMLHLVSWLLLSSPGAGEDGGLGSVFCLVLRTRFLVYTKSSFVQCQRWDKLLFILNHLPSKECSFKTREVKTFTAWWSVSLGLIGCLQKSSSAS